MQYDKIAPPLFITRATLDALEQEEGLPGIGNYYLEVFTERGLWKLVE